MIIAYPEPIETWVPAPDCPITDEIKEELRDLCQQGARKEVRRTFSGERVLRIQDIEFTIESPSEQVIAQLPHLADLQFAHLKATVWCEVENETAMIALEGRVKAYYKQPKAA